MARQAAIKGSCTRGRASLAQPGQWQVHELKLIHPVLAQGIGGNEQGAGVGSWRGCVERGRPAQGAGSAQVMSRGRRSGGLLGDEWNAEWICTQGQAAAASLTPAARAPFQPRQPTLTSPDSLLCRPASLPVLGLGLAHRHRLDSSSMTTRRRRGAAAPVPSASADKEGGEAVDGGAAAETPAKPAPELSSAAAAPALVPLSELPAYPSDFIARRLLSFAGIVLGYRQDRGRKGGGREGLE